MSLLSPTPPGNNMFLGLATPTAELRPATSASPKGLVEMHNLRLHPRATDPESAFSQDLQVIQGHVKVWEALARIQGGKVHR